MGHKLYEKLPIVATIDPDAYATGTVSTDVIDCRYFSKVLFVVQTGTFAAGTTLDFDIREMTAATTGTTTATTNTDITQLAATADSDKQVIVEVDTADLSNRYIKGVMVIGGAGGDAGVIAFGYPGRYQPANDYDLASVDEIVTS